MVKSSFAPAIVLPELGPTTSENELNDLLAEIDKEIALDPELTQDLLDILNDEDAEMLEEEEEDFEPVQGAAGFSGQYDYLDEPMDSEFYGDEEKLEEEKLEEEDPEMVEMMKMLEEAEKDFKEEDLDKFLNLEQEAANSTPKVKKIIFSSSSFCKRSFSCCFLRAFSSSFLSCFSSSSSSFFSSKTRFLSSNFFLLFLFQFRHLLPFL